MIILESDREINCMKGVASIVVQTPVEIKNAVKSGISNPELDKIAERYKRSSGTVPAFKGYGGAANMIFMSLKHKVVCGVPRFKKLKNGDNVSIDIGAVRYGSQARWAQKLPTTTERGLFIGIEEAIEANRLGDSSNAHQTQGKSCGYGIVRDYVGHGISRKMHENPQIPNYGSASRDPRLQSGMILLVEPRIDLRPHVVKTVDGDLNETLGGNFSAFS